VFTRENGQVLHPEQITKRFARLVRDAGLPPITLHGIRHSYATAALAAGEPLKVVSERLGHASTSITATSTSMCCRRWTSAPPTPSPT
jgi:integrase